jgi:hypothetical protein
MEVKPLECLCPPKKSVVPHFLSKRVFKKPQVKSWINLVFSILFNFKILKQKLPNEQILQENKENFLSCI